MLKLRLATLRRSVASRTLLRNIANLEFLPAHDGEESVRVVSIRNLEAEAQRGGME
jgi:hypothetical protein